jgi:SnoaL-like domain
LEEREASAWLEAYGSAWAARDSAAFVRLFSQDVHYHWTPFEAPRVGRDAVAAAFETATARQERIAFRSSVIGVRPGQALAHWRCSFVRVGSGLTVQLDGIFLMEFNAEGACSRFREWWHSDEPAADP